MSLTITLGGWVGYAIIAMLFIDIAVTGVLAVVNITRIRLMRIGIREITRMALAELKREDTP